MATIDKDTVKHIAILARLTLDEDALAAYSAQLESILSYITKLNELNTETTLPTSHALTTLKNVFRKDIIKPSLDVEDVLSNAPAKEEGFFKVPKVIEGK